VDEGHGLREIQQETLFFLIKLTMFFFFRFLDSQRMGILQSTGVFVLGFPAISLQLWTQELLWIFLESTFETSKMLTQRNATQRHATQRKVTYVKPCEAVLGNYFQPHLR
jgi:hypothetical protein